LPVLVGASEGVGDDAVVVGAVVVDPDPLVEAL
jgi:hypothetical protein